MSIPDKPWPALRAELRQSEDATLQLLTRWPVAYGSPEWHALPADHPHRHLAMRRAAEAWSRYWRPEAVATRRAAELDVIDRAVADRFKAVSADLSAVWDWSRHAAGPTYGELKRRRALVSRLQCRTCSAVVELVHPLPDELAARLPDTSWVRCAAHENRPYLTTAEEIAA